MKYPAPSVLPHLDKLDQLIVEHAGSKSALLRNQVSIAREQIEAFSLDFEQLRNELIVLRNTTDQKLEDLSATCQRLTGEKQGLERQLAEVNGGVSELMPETVGILKMFFGAPGGLSTASLDFQLDLPTNKVRYHVGVLGDRYLIRVFTSARDHSDDQAQFIITQEGRAYLMERGLADS